MAARAKGLSDDDFVLDSWSAAEHLVTPTSERVAPRTGRAELEHQCDSNIQFGDVLPGFAWCKIEV